MTQSEQSKLVDPFERQSILSLHPRTFRDSPKSNDLEAIHQYMTSLALQNSGKVFGEAQSIIDGASKIVNTTENSEPIMKENEAPRKNRPALPRKRAKFSMKPAISQPYTVTEPTLERDKLPRDPKKYFEAVKEHENAVKELKRQRGEDTNEPKKPTTARQRRPEIAWRKATYQHHVYSSQPESDTVFSQEPVQDTIRSQPIHNSQHESVIANDQSKEKEGAETVTRAEDRVKKLFDELLSSNIADLDENEALSYLKDRLNIKPVSIPDDIPRVDFLSSFDSIEGLDMLPATRAFSDNLERNTLGKPKKLPDKLVNSPSSPTPPRNPFLAISKLSKLLSRSTESDDPFSARGVDLFPDTTCEIISGPSAGASKDKEFVESAGRGKEFVESASKGNLSEVLIGKEHREEMHNMEEMDVDIEGNGEDMVDKAASPTPTRLYLDVDENINDNLHCENEIGDNIEDTTEKVVPSSPQENVEITMEDLESNRSPAQKDDSSNNVPAATPDPNPDMVSEQQNEIEDTTEKVVPSSPQENVEITMEDLESNRSPAQKDDSSNNVPAATPDPNPDMVSEQQNEESPKTINKRVKSRARKVDPKKKRHSLAAQKDDSSNNVPAATSDPNPDMVSEQQNEESPKTINKREKSRAHKVNPKKKRHSLAGGGSSWAGGVRKSNRIKTKPLEYWKGERPLYARIHDSLPTVVGVKYLSPSTAGFKVKSYVADKYKDLVDLSSLH